MARRTRVLVWLALVAADTGGAVAPAWSLKPTEWLVGYCGRVVSVL